MLGVNRNRGHLMGFRFQRRGGLAGRLVRLNVTKSGLSASLGPRGISYNVGLIGPRAKKQDTVSIGLPGTGLSYRTPINVTPTTRYFLLGLAVLVVLVFALVH
jgi:Protein of unknown function (DUF4236)